MYNCKNYIFLILLFVCWSEEIQGQVCGCTACPLSVPVGTTEVVNFEVTGATTNLDLAGSQSVCAVAVDFSPANLYGIEMTLTSPSGQSVQLVGPTAVGAGTGTSFWDISFVQCMDNAIPDVPFSPQWNNAQAWPINGIFTGSYYPLNGCLEDFNTGTVNGNWTLTVVNGNTNPMTLPASINDFYLTFCEDIGIDCNPCGADAGDYSALPDLTLCNTPKDLMFAVAPNFPNGAPDPAEYTYRYVIAENDIILDYQEPIDMSDAAMFGTGTYTICGFSILSDDVPSLIANGFFPPDGMTTVGALNNFVSGNTATVCGDLSDDCFTVEIDPVPTAPTIDTPDLIPCTEPNSIELSGNVFPATAPYTWSAINGGTLGAGTNTLTPEALTPGTYILTIQFPASFCSSADTVEVLADTSVPATFVPTPDSLGCENSSVDLNATVTGVQLSYEWIDLSDNSIISVTPNTTVFDAGTYLFVATQGTNGCSDSLEVEVFGASDVPVAVAAQQDTISCFDTTVLLDGSMSSGADPINYAWYDSGSNLLSSNDTFTVSIAGVYELIVTNPDNGCTDTTYTTVVALDARPTSVVQTPDTLDCMLDLVTMDGSDSFRENGSLDSLNYIWLNSDNDTLGLSPTHGVIFAGVYRLVVQDQVSGCTDTSEVEVVKLDIVPTAIPTIYGDLNCQDDEVTVDALSSLGVNDLTYEWYDGFWNYIDNADAIMVNSTDFYNLLVIDEVSGCVDSLRFSVAIDTISPIADATVSGLISCSNNQVTLNANGTNFENLGTFEWIDSGGMSVGVGANYLATTTGQYLLIATDTVNFCVDSLFIEVEGDLSGVEAIISPDTLNCTQTTLILDGQNSNGPPNLAYEWQDGGGGFLGDMPTQSITMPDTYTLIVSIPNTACSDTTEVVVPLISEQPMVSVITDTGVTLDCNNPLITAEGSVLGGFEWFDDNWNLLVTTFDLEITSSGTYYFVGTSNVTQCKDTVELVIDDNFIYPNAVATAQGDITCVQDSVLLIGSGSSGQGPLGYQWYDQLLLPLGDQVNDVAYTAGTYTLVVENLDFGCTDTTTVLVEQVADVPVAVIDSTGTLDCGGTSMIVLDGSNSMSTGVLAYEWVDISDMSIVSIDSIANITSAGVYALNITDTNSNCTSSTTILINNSARPSASITFTGVIDCSNFGIDLLGGDSNGSGMLDYEWQDSNGNSIGAGGQDIFVTAGGMYSLIVGHELNDCVDTMTIEVLENLIHPTAAGFTPDSLSCIDPVAVITPAGSASGNMNSQIGFAWFDPSNDLIGNSALEVAFIPGDYILIVTDSVNLCKDTAIVVVPGDIDPPFAEIGLSGIGCDISDLFMSGINSTPTDSVTFIWEDNFGAFIGNGVIQPVDSLATYVLIVMDDYNGCIDTTSIVIDDNGSAVQAVATVSNELDCANDSAVLDASMSVGNNTLLYEWYDPQGIAFINSPMVAISESGTYTVVIFEDLSGCTDTATVEVIQSPNSVAANIQSSAPVLNCEFPTIQLDGSGSTGDNLQYFWRNVMGDSLASGAIYAVSDPNFYWLIITDTLTSCQDSVSLIVPQMNEVPTAMATVSDTINCLQSSVVIDGSGSFSAANHPIEYQWFNQGTPLGNSAMQIANAAGMYELVVIDTITSCTDTMTVEVFQSSDQPTAIITIDQQISCSSNTAILNSVMSQANGTPYLEWTDATFTPIGVNPTLSVTSAGTYYLIFEDLDSQCADTTSVEIMQNEGVPTAVFTIDGVFRCDVDEVTLNGALSTTTGSTIIYEWKNGGGMVIGTNPLEVVNIPDTYTLIVTDSLSGCVDSIAMTTLENTALPTATVVVTDTLGCQTDSVLLVGGASSIMGVDYEWFNPSMTLIGTTPSINVGDPGLYNFVVTDTLNACTDTLEVEVFANTGDVNASIAIPDSLGCGIESVLLDGTASLGSNLIYEWKNSLNITIGVLDTTSVTDVGLYTLVVSDATGECTDSTTIEVFGGGGDLLSAVIAIPDSLGCGIESVLLDGTSSVGSNLIYEWKNSLDITIGVLDTTSVTDVGLYTLVVSDATGECMDSTTIEVFGGGGALLEASIAVPDSLGCGIESVLLDGTSSVGSNLIYEWKNSLDITIGVLDTTSVTDVGMYTLVVSDATGECADSTTIEVFGGGGDLLSAVIAIPDLLGCGIENVLLDGTSSVGANLSYEWKNSIGTTIGNLDTTSVSDVGMYTLVVSDATGECTDSTTIEVFGGGGDFPVMVSVSGSFDCETESVTLSAAGSGGGAPVTYEWKNSNQEIVGIAEEFEALDPGDYTLVVSTLDGSCVDSTDVVVEINPTNLFASASVSDVLSCDVGEVVLDATASNGATSLIYLWQYNNIIVENGDTAYVSDPGIYTLFIASENGVCVDSTTIEVFQAPGSVVANAIAEGSLTCSTLSVNLNGSNSQGNGLSYEWFNPIGTSMGDSQNATATSPGVYQLHIASMDGACTDSTSVEVFERKEFPQVIVAEIEDLSCHQDTVLLNALPSTGMGDLAYNWFNEDWSLVDFEATFTTMAGGDYYSVVTDVDTGCSDTLAVMVNEDFNEPTAVINQQGGFGCGNNVVNLDGAGSSGQGSLGYEWINNVNSVLGNSDTISVFNPGEYHLVVTDSINGCTDTMMVVLEDGGGNMSSVANVSGAIDCNQTSVVIDGAGSSTGNDVSYLWYDSQDIPFSNNLAETVMDAGQYWLVVSNGVCSDTSYVNVVEDTMLPTAVISGPDPLTINCGDQVILDATESITNDTLIGSWFPLSSVNDYADSDSLQPIVGTTGWIYFSVENTTNGCVATDSLLIQSFQGATTAGNDTLICGDAYSLSASLDTNFTGVWTIPDGLQINDITSPDATITGMLPGETYVLTWTISTDGCPDFASDTVVIDIEEGSIAVDDSFEFEGGIGPFEFDILTNDELFDQDLNYTILSNPAEGTIDDNGDGALSLSFPNIFSGALSFEYELCGNNCPSYCDTAIVNIQIDSIDIETVTIDIPNAITPNDDGINDLFIIDYLDIDPGRYPQNELAIFNRWGDVVFKASPYNNNWGGNNKLGFPLPAGTYYYILRLDLQNGIIFKGDLTILR